MTKLTKTKVSSPPKLKYGVEFFHIYSDERISAHHKKSIEYLKTVQEVWGINTQLIIMIDDYNPVDKGLKPETVLNFLKNSAVSPAYWAFESSLAQYAPIVLESITDKRIKKSYTKYIQDHNKFPCSLLTSTWYLIRLGVIDGADIIQQYSAEEAYAPVDRLINILPSDYKEVELKVQKLLLNSTYRECAHKIQDLFYSAKVHHKLDIF